MIEAERIFHAREALAESLAHDVAEELMRAIEAKGKATLAVSGGTTPKTFFAKLSQIDLPWHRVTVTLVDERQVPETSERSNARLVRETLLVEQGGGREIRAADRYRRCREPCRPSTWPCSAWAPTGIRPPSFRAATGWPKR